MWHDTKKIVSEPRTVPRCFSLYYLDQVITLQTPPVTYAPRTSSVQVRCPIAACAFATADKGPRLVDISLVAIYFGGLCLVGPSQVSRHAAVETATGMDRS